MQVRKLTEQDIAAAAPRFYRPTRNWSGMCEAAAFNLTDVFSTDDVRSFPTATAARHASKIEGSGFGPGGNFVWMSGVWGTENGRAIDYGHVAYHVGGGLLFMASSSVRTIPGFTALGFIDGPAYMRRFSGQRLEGWSYDHGGTIITQEEVEEMGLYTEQDKKDIQAARADAAAARASAEEAVRLLKALGLRSDNIQRGQDEQLRAEGIAKPVQAE